MGQQHTLVLHHRSQQPQQVQGRGSRQQRAAGALLACLFVTAAMALVLAMLVAALASACTSGSRNEITD
jgi:hypothetical protein